MLLGINKIFEILILGFSHESADRFGTDKRAVWVWTTQLNASPLPPWPAAPCPHRCIKVIDLVGQPENITGCLTVAPGTELPAM